MTPVLWLLMLLCVLIVAEFIAIWYLASHVRSVLSQVTRVLNQAEKHGEITDRQKARVEEVVTAASDRAQQVAAVAATVTTERAQDIKQFVRDEVARLRTEFAGKFDHLEDVIRPNGH